MKKENSIERIVPSTREWDLYIGNHMSRYEFALQKILPFHDNLKILDIACGVGYGTSFLAKKLPKSYFTGVDISAEAIDQANLCYKSANMKYILDDCTNPESEIKNEKYNVIVSFETLEHLKNPDLFLSFVRNALTEDGVFIISTPNRLVTSANGLEWDFHEIEYSPLEFEKLLTTSGLRPVNYYGQQKSSLGKFRLQLIGEINKLKSNPFYRIGKLFQKIKGSYLESEFFEDAYDYQIKENKIEFLENLGLEGPDVLIAVCRI